MDDRKGGMEVSGEGEKGKGDLALMALGERPWSPVFICEPWPH